MKKLFDHFQTNVVFILSAVILFAIVLWGIIAPDLMNTVTTNVMNMMTEYTGWFYIFITALFIGFCFYLGIGPYRYMKLGTKESTPDYSYFTWIGMLFAAGMGVGLVFWAIGEPLSHYANPPEGIDAETKEAARTGLLLSIFHWGFHPWAIYAVVALGIAFAKYRKNLPGLISSSFYPLIGKQVSKWPGKLIDIIAIIATTVGIATSFGLSSLQFGSGLQEVFGLPNNSLMQLIIISVITAIFLFSVVSGLDKGMRYLSIFNLGLSGVLLIVIIIIGPTVYIIEQFSKTIGDYLSSFVQLTFYTTPHTDNEWMGEWTLFYWAWIISWSPFVGTFIARVSRGRTLGEFMIGVLLIPTFATIIWFVAFGGTGLHMELNGEASIATEISETPEIGLFLVLEQLSGSMILSVMAIVLIGVFFITSANSATYVLGVFSSEGKLNPKNITLVIWGLLISAIATTLLLNGGLNGLQAIATITALPFGIIMIFMVAAIIRSLRKEGEEKEQVERQENW